MGIMSNYCGDGLRAAALEIQSHEKVHINILINESKGTKIGIKMEH